MGREYCLAGTSAQIAVRMQRGTGLMDCDRFRGGPMIYRSGWGWAFFVLAFLVGGVLFAPAAGAEESHERAAIRALLEAQATAWNAGDIEGFMAGYWKSEETEFAGASGVLRGWQAVLDRYRRTYPDRKAMGRLTFSDLKINALSRNAAYIVGRWQLERENDHPGGVFTLIVRKFPEGWRIVHDHTSAFAPPASSERK